MKIAGILLIVAGVLALVYGGYSYTSEKKIVDAGPLQLSTKENKTVPISPLLGIAGILGGGALIYLGSRGKL